jgi:RNA polymerase sigma-70 factor, ECF subfamily
MRSRYAVDGELRLRFQSDLIPLLEPLRRRAMGITRNHADAEDLLQETMVKAYTGFRTFQLGSNFHAWLSRILINTYISDYRKRQHLPTQCPFDDIVGSLPADVSNGVQGLRSVEDEALNALPDEKIRAAMLALPEPFRLAVYYADIEGFRPKEIADLMRIPVGTVNSRLHRGRRFLRRLLTDVAQQLTAHPTPRVSTEPENTLPAKVSPSRGIEDASLNTLSKGNFR